MFTEQFTIKTRKHLVNYLTYLKKENKSVFDKMRDNCQFVLNEQQFDTDVSAKELAELMIQHNNNEAIKSFGQKAINKINLSEDGFIPFFARNVSLSESEIKNAIKHFYKDDNYIMPYDSINFLKKYYQNEYQKLNLELGTERNLEKADNIIKDNIQISLHFSKFNEFQKKKLSKAMDKLTLEQQNRFIAKLNYRETAKNNRTYRDYDSSEFFFNALHFDKRFVHDMLINQETQERGGLKADAHYIFPAYSIKNKLMNRHSSEKMNAKRISIDQRALSDLENYYDRIIMQGSAFGYQSKLQLDELKNALYKKLKDDLKLSDSFIKELSNSKSNLFVDYKKESRLLLVELLKMNLDNHDFNDSKNIKETIDKLLKKENVNLKDCNDTLKYLYKNFTEIKTKELTSEIISVLNKKTHNKEIYNKLSNNGIKLKVINETVKNKKKGKFNKAKKVNILQIKDLDIEIRSDIFKDKELDIAFSNYQYRRDTEMKLNMSLEDFSSKFKTTLKNKNFNNTKELVDYLKSDDFYLKIRTDKNKKFNGGSIFFFKNNEKIDIKFSSLDFDFKNMIFDLINKEVEQQKKAQVKILEDKEYFENQLLELERYALSQNKNDYFEFQYKSYAVQEKQDFVYFFMKQNEFHQKHFLATDNKYFDRSGKYKKLEVVKNNDESTTYRLFDNSKKTIQLTTELIINNAIEKHNKKREVSVISSKSYESLSKVYIELMLNLEKTNLIKLEFEDKEFIPNSKIKEELRIEIDKINEKNYKDLMNRLEKTHRQNKKSFSFYKSYTQKWHLKEFRYCYQQILCEAVINKNIENIYGYNISQLLDDKDDILNYASENFDDISKLEKFFEKYNHFESKKLEIEKIKEKISKENDFENSETAIDDFNEELEKFVDSNSHNNDDLNNFLSNAIKKQEQKQASNNEKEQTIDDKQEQASNDEKEQVSNDDQEQTTKIKKKKKNKYNY